MFSLIQKIFDNVVAVSAASTKVEASHADSEESTILVCLSRIYE